MDSLSAYFLLQQLSRQRTPGPVDADRARAEAEAPPAPRWQRAALIRGLYTGLQAYDATNLVVSLTNPKAADKTAALAEKIAVWEQRMQAYDLKPAQPGKMKSAWGYLLYMAGYLAPVIALGTTLTLGLGMVLPVGVAALAAIASTCLINTHQAAGEALLQTARNHKDIKLHEPGSLAASLQTKEFLKTVRHNVVIKSAISLGFTAVAGPVARLFGSFSGGLIRGLLTQTPLGKILGRGLMEALEHSILRSTYTTIGGWLANLSIANGKGPASVFAAVAGAAASTTAAITAVHGATAAVFRRVAEQPEPAEKTPTIEKFTEAATADKKPAQETAPAEAEKAPPQQQPSAP